jgi:hypothetical protein
VAGPELDEAAFLTELLDRTGALLLLDVANLYANARNHGGDPLAFLDALPLERIAYVHVAGGVERDGLYHDTHAHPTPDAVLDLVAELCARTAVLDSASHAAPGQPFSPEACAPPTAATQAPEPGIRDRRPRRDPPGSCSSATTTTRPSRSSPPSWTPSPPPPDAGWPVGEHRPGAARRRAGHAGQGAGRRRPGARRVRPGPGQDFGGRFLAFAAGRPPPVRGGAPADGLAFARALARQGRLPGNARVEALLAAAHLSPSPARLAATLAGPPRRLVVTVRLPALGDRWPSLPLG